MIQKTVQYISNFILFCKDIIDQPYARYIIISRLCCLQGIYNLSECPWLHTITERATRSRTAPPPPPAVHRDKVTEQFINQQRYVNCIRYTSDT
jgi:hypothetical protein